MEFELFTYKQVIGNSFLLQYCPGTIGVFSFITLLINLVSGIVLVRVATTVVDLVAIRLLPQKNHYKYYKFI
jgi:hypothetical protein